MINISFKVSIVLPTYNGSKYIRQSIDSCLNQTYKNLELIIVDDGSSDKTPEIIKSYKDKRIKYIQHKKNKGLSCALNAGFANTTGEYLTWTSDDNYYAEDAIEKMLSFANINNFEFVYCDFYRFNDQVSTEMRVVKLPNVPKLGSHNDIGACFLYSKNIKEVIGEYNPVTHLAEDYDYWIRISKRFKMYHLNEPLYYYREHINSLSLSKLFEIRIVDVLVRLKNNVLDMNEAEDYLIGLIAHRYLGFFKINKIFVKILLLEKIKKVLNEFNMGQLSFSEAKIILKNIIFGKSYV
ncbi:MAG: glycosyltransferase [Ignavibacteriales bacterium]|nr:glycosyltransferase [Ignavibacteriales bacterium]